MMTKIEGEKEKPKPGGRGGGGSTSTSATPPPPGGPDDRISELPVEILHRILGFLEMDKFLIGTSLVSTKWRYLWKSVSILKFPTCCITSTRRTDDDSDSEKYQNFVDNVLRLRDSEASKIEIFRYCCRYGSIERLHNFIVSAVVNQGAQQIQVKGFILGNFRFDPSIFNSGLLRVFNFTSGSPGFGIHFPRSMCCATQLTHLSLCGIRLPEGDADSAQLHLVCPLLETLVMRCCYSKHLKVLDISAPRLNSLSICNSGMRYEDFDGLGGCRIEIRTPNLTSLVYFGCVYVDCFTENLPRITKAKLKFYVEPGMVEQTTSFAFKLFKGLSSAQTLALGGFEVFSQDTLKVLLKPFTSLRTLKLVTTWEIFSIHGMVLILNSCSSIEKLVWEGNMSLTWIRHLMLPQCSLPHLKHIHIKRLGGHENEIDFVKFLLKSSVVLEDIVINTFTKYPSRLIIEEKLKQFIGEEP